jgi:hypothetical protein
MPVAPRGVKRLPSSSTGVLGSFFVAKRKNPAAVALGRLGGKAAAGAGARVRYAAMTAEERRALARKAARARWTKAKRSKP